MKNRDIQLIDLRPTLELPIEPTSTLEKFQNATLRPVLKVQNDILVQIFVQKMKKQKVNFDKMIGTTQVQYIANVLKKDMKLRNFYLGTIVGHFSIEEYTQYLAAEREYNRRIITMLTQRLQDQLVAID